MKEEEIKYAGAKGVPTVRKGGTAEQVSREGWRVYRPVVDYAKCIKCKTCYVFCPDSAIKWIDGKPVFDYKMCKGCLVCESECPVKAIHREEEK